MLVLAALSGLFAYFGAAIAGYERVDRMLVSATLAPDGGPTAVHEVIDYDFGSVARHGLARRIPDLPLEGPIRVTSPNAPSHIAAMDYSNVGDGLSTEVRIGDPHHTVRGEHRYVLDYPLTTVDDGHHLSWDAVGTGWESRIGTVRVDIVAPFTFVDPQCETGADYSTTPCPISEVVPGHLVVQLKQLPSGHGVTISAGRGDALPAVPSVPAPPPPRSGTTGLPAELIGILAGVLALAGGVTGLRLVRRWGRDRVRAGGAAAAASALDAPGGSEALLGRAGLAALATTDFVPPAGLTPPQGGILMAEAVLGRHLEAWLLDAAARGAVAIEQHDRTVTLRRTAPGDADLADLLDQAFSGRTEMTLGRLDDAFAAAWDELGAQLQDWADESGLWDQAADRRRYHVLLRAGFGLVLGFVVTAALGALAGRWSGWWALPLAPAAVAAGVVAGIVAYRFELPVRTPRGSALWLQTESFRRFLHDSEGPHVEAAAQQGRLLEYTAWAVALGEASPWAKAVEATTGLTSTTPGLAYIAMLPSLGASTTRAPGTSSSGGGSGGVGSGGGGGGGGSW